MLYRDGHRAVGAGPAGPAATGPIFGQLTHAKIPCELWWIIQFKRSYARRDLGWQLSSTRFLLGLEESTLCRRMSPSKRKFWETTLTIDYCDFIFYDSWSQKCRTGLLHITIDCWSFKNLSCEAEKDVIRTRSSAVVLLISEPNTHGFTSCIHKFFLIGYEYVITNILTHHISAVLRTQAS